MDEWMLLTAPWIGLCNAFILGWSGWRTATIYDLEEERRRRRPGKGRRDAA